MEVGNSTGRGTIGMDKSSSLTERVLTELGGKLRNSLKTMTQSEAPKKKYWTSTPFFGLGALDPPPPKIPTTQCSHPDKKGTILLLLEFCIHLHTHQYLKL